MSCILHHRRLLAAVISCTLAAGAAVAAPGELDPSFALDGVAYYDSGSDYDVINDLLPVAGNVAYAAAKLSDGNGSSHDLSVIRILADGSIDGSFGEGGIARAGLGEDGDLANALVRDDQDRLVVVGALEPGAHTNFGVARFDADGVLDTTFGDFAAPPRGTQGVALRTGMTHFPMAPTSSFNEEATAVALQSDGRIVVAGIGFAPEGNFHYQRFAIARLEEDGTIDAGFGDAGRIIAPPVVADAGNAEYLTGIALRRDGTLPPDDRITVVGYVFARNTAVIRRYTADGQPDPSFDGDGVLTLSSQSGGGVHTGMHTIRAAVLQDDGKLVVAGESTSRAFTIMRFNVNGSLDTGFGSNGRVAVKFSEPSDYDTPHAITLENDGDIVIAGNATAVTNDLDFAVVRLTPAGVPDPDFAGGTGKVAYPLSAARDEARAVAVLSRGEILVAGFAHDDDRTNQADDAAMLRLLGDPEIFRDGFESD